MTDFSLIIMSATAQIDPKNEPWKMLFARLAEYAKPRILSALNDHQYYCAEWVFSQATCPALNMPDETAVKSIVGEFQLDIQTDVDIVTVPLSKRSIKLMIADMDSTVLEGESIDEMADLKGKKTEVAAVTHRAMAGELDFFEAFQERLMVLEKLPKKAIEQLLHSAIKVRPGAPHTVKTLSKMGVVSVMASGGFSIIAAQVQEYCGFDYIYAHDLQFDNHDELIPELPADIVDANKKAEILAKHCNDLSISLQETLAIGDGANDIPMLQSAGIGIAFHAKPAAQKAADIIINHASIVSLLWCLGIKADI